MRKPRKPKISLPIYISVYVVLAACVFVAWSELHKYEQQREESIKNIRVYVANNSRNIEPLEVELYANHQLVYHDTTSKTFTESQFHVAPGEYHFELRIVNHKLSRTYQHLVVAGQVYMFSVTYEYEPPYTEARKYLLKEAYEYEQAHNKTRDTTYWARYFDQHQYRFPEKPRDVTIDIANYKEPNSTP